LQITNQMKDNTLTILSYEIEDKIETTRLTKIQKLVCKWFKITPEKLYLYTIEVKVRPGHSVRSNDDILMKDESLWRIIKIMGEYVILYTIRPGDILIAYSNSWAEDSNIPNSKR
jgi:hypothetical protein